MEMFFSVGPKPENDFQNIISSFLHMSKVTYLFTLEMP